MPVLPGVASCSTAMGCVCVCVCPVLCLSDRAPESGCRRVHLDQSLWVLLGVPWVSDHLSLTWRGCAKQAALLARPNFGGGCSVVSVPPACSPRRELARGPLFLQTAVWQNMEENAALSYGRDKSQLAAAAEGGHCLSLFLAILFLPTRPRGLNRSSPKAKSGAWASSPATPCCHPANNRLGVPHPLPAPAPRSLPAAGLPRDRAAEPSRAEPGLGPEPARSPGL